MSLILEALRKSEAERRRGAAPDVAMELPPAPVARTRAASAWLLPALAAGALAILAALWWSQRGQPTSEAIATQADATTQPAIDAPAVVVRTPPPPTAPPPAAIAPAPAPPAPAATRDPQPPSPQPQALPPPAMPAPAPSQGIADIGDTALPPVKLSMHMWDAVPGKRFVILEGQRMGEGDRIGAIAVIEIERGGVVIERNGQRARITLP